MPDTPIAYFLTFTTYGSWLHGDARGSKDRRHNTPGEAPRGPSGGLAHYETEELRHPVATISPSRRRFLEESFAATCDHRRWPLLAMNVRQEHVHIVVGSDDERRPERVLTDLKAYATRALRGQGLLDAGAALWSRHGSTHWLWNERDVEAAMDYTLNYQGRDLPGASWRKWRQLLP